MSGSQIKLGAVLVGWITSLFLLFAVAMLAIGMVISLGVDIESTQKAGFFSSFSAILLVALSTFSIFFAGGYVAGRMAAYAGPINGAMTVAITLVAIAFVATFAIIIGNNLGIDATGPVFNTVSSFSIALLLLSIVALAGGALGGKLGEGYFKRLNTALAMADSTQSEQKESFRERLAARFNRSASEQSRD